MNVKIKCMKCGSDNVKIISHADATPMYKCGKCGYEHNLFPKFGNAETKDK